MWNIIVHPLMELELINRERVFHVFLKGDLVFFKPGLYVCMLVHPENWKPDCRTETVTWNAVTPFPPLPPRFRPPPSDDAPAAGPGGGSRPEGRGLRLLQSTQPRGHSQGQGSRDRGRNGGQVQPSGTDHPRVRLRDLTLHPLHPVQGTTPWHDEDGEDARPLDV